MSNSTLHAFDYADFESDYQFTLSRHYLIIFECKYCKNAKISGKKKWTYMSVIINTSIEFSKYSVFAFH